MLVRVTIVYYIFCESSYKERKGTKTNKYRRYKIKDIYLKTHNGYAKLMVFTRAPTKKGKIKQTKKTKIKANDRIDQTESTPRPIVVTIRVREIGYTCCTQKGNYIGWCGWRSKLYRVSNLTFIKFRVCSRLLIMIYSFPL